MALPIAPTWALETNFAAGPNPWNGQPCKVPPVGDVFIPNTKPPAENLNYMFNLRDGYLASVLQWQGIQFRPAYVQPLGTLVNLSAVAYDPIALKWMLGGLTAGTLLQAAAGRGADGDGWVALIAA